MEKKENKIIISVDPKLYSLEAIYGAAYTFLDKAYIYLEEGPKSKIKINIKGKSKLSEKKLKNLKDEFLNELLSFSLRDKISKNNKKIREYIVSRALASALPEFKRPIERKEQTLEAKSLLRDGAWDKEALKEEFEKTLFSQKNLEEVVIPWKKKNQNQEECPSLNEAGSKKGRPIWEKDPEGIAVPWEEKHLKQKNKKYAKRKLTAKKK